MPRWDPAVRSELPCSTPQPLCQGPSSVRLGDTERCQRAVARKKRDKLARHLVNCCYPFRVPFTQSLGVKGRYLAGMKLTVFYD